MTDATPTADAAPLTVVLVHGAFADASNWAGVIPTLLAAGVNVLAPANPLRGIDHDAAYIASVASQIPGPVLLVAHSYGGAVITNAGTRASPPSAAGRFTAMSSGPSGCHGCAPGRSACAILAPGSVCPCRVGWANVIEAPPTTTKQKRR